MNVQCKRGRPTKGLEAKSERYGLRLTPTRRQQLEELSTLYRCSIAEVIEASVTLFEYKTKVGLGKKEEDIVAKVLGC